MSVQVELNQILRRKSVVTKPNNGPFNLEALEPRVFLSADGLTGAPANDLSAGDPMQDASSVIVETIEDTLSTRGAGGLAYDSATGLDDMFGGLAESTKTVLPGSQTAGEQTEMQPATGGSSAQDSVAISAPISTAPTGVTQSATVVQSGPAPTGTAGNLTSTAGAVSSGISNPITDQLTTTLHVANAPPQSSPADQSHASSVSNSPESSSESTFGSISRLSSIGAANSALTSSDSGAIPATATAKTIAFVDTGLADYQALIRAISGGDTGASAGSESNEIILLDAGRDGFEQITEALASRSGVSAIHIFSHGSTGSLLLGATRVDAAGLNAYAEQFATWNRLLTADADILLYGCNIGSGERGAEFIARLAALTGADVTASVDETGSALLGGDWDLEASTGEIEATPLSDSGSPDGYHFLLPDVVVDGDAGKNTFTIANQTATRQGNTPKNVGVADTLTVNGLAADDTFNVQAYSQGMSTTLDGGPGTKDKADLNGVGTKMNLDVGAAGTEIKVYDVQVGGTNNDPLRMTLKNVEEIVAGSNTNTLNLGALNVALLIRVVEANKVEVLTLNAGTAADPVWTLILTASNIHNVKGGKSQNLFVIGKGGKLDGTIHGGAGDNNVLSYSDTFTARIGAQQAAVMIVSGAKSYGNSVNLEIMAGSSTDGKATAIKGGQADGFKNIHAFIGGPENDMLAATAGSNAAVILSGGAGNDEITGSTAADTLSGGDGNDTLTGWGGADMLAGGDGDDTYVVPVTAELMETIKEDDGEGNDTLDFSAVRDTTPLTVEIHPNANLAGAGGFTDPNHGVMATAPGGRMLNATYVESVVGGAAINTYNFHPNWGWFATMDTRKTVTITIDDTKDGLPADNGTKFGTLDFSEVKIDLAFTVEAPGRVTVEGTQKWGNTTYTFVVKASGIASVTGGKGNNTYTFKAGGKLEGTLTGGAPGQAPGKQNILDYSGYNDSVTANLTGGAIEPTPANAPVIEPFGVVMVGKLPVQEEWTFTIAATQGSMVLGTQESNFDSAHRNELDEQKFKDLLAQFLKRNDFSVTKNKGVVGVPVQTTWTILFSAPGPLGGFFDSVKNNLKFGTAGVATVTSITFASGGSGYGAAPVVTIAPPGDPMGTQATATATLGVTNESFIIAGGTTVYSVAPIVTISGGNGTEAEATAVLTGGVVTGITITKPGKGFTASPILVFSGGTIMTAGTNPTGAGNAANFTVSGITVTNGGSGYTAVPAVTIALPGAGGTEVTSPLATVFSAKQDEGVTAADRTWNVHTTAVNGSFRLTVTFQDKLGNPVTTTGPLPTPPTTADIPYNASPDQIQELLQDAIDMVIGANPKISPNKFELGLLDVDPVVLVVGGMGTAAFPWRIIFANMGDAILTPGANTLIAGTLLPPNQASGITTSVTGITQVIGSSKPDRIYGTHSNSRMITDFNGADGYSLSGSTLTLTNVDAAKNLQTGQAVLYTVAAGYKPINGLNSGQVYFIKVGESGGKPTLKFYLDPKEIDKFLGKTISLKVPEGDVAAAMHTLKEVFVVNGGAGNDWLVAPINAQQANANQSGLFDLGGKDEQQVASSGQSCGVVANSCQAEAVVGLGREPHGDIGVGREGGHDVGGAILRAVIRHNHLEVSWHISLDSNRLEHECEVPGPAECGDQDRRVDRRDGCRLLGHRKCSLASESTFSSSSRASVHPSGSRATSIAPSESSPSRGTRILTRSLSVVRSIVAPMASAQRATSSRSAAEYTW